MSDKARVLIAFLAIVAASCGDYEHRAELDSLVRERATEAEVVKRLNLKFDIRERGTPEWNDLQSFLAREPTTTLRPLREAVKKYPRILCNTTAWQMTWVFVDEQGIARDYYLTSQ